MGLFGGRTEVEPRPEQKWDAIVGFAIDLSRLGDYATNKNMIDRALETSSLLPCGLLWLMATFTLASFFQ